MTVTDEKTSTSTAYVVEVGAPAPLVRALTNAMACAGKDDMLPVLKAASVFYDGEHTLEVRSTDRFVALFEQVATSTADDAPACGAFQLLLPYAGCQAAVAFLKAAPKAQPVALEWTPINPIEPDWSGARFEQGSLRLKSYEGSVELTTLQAEGPKLRALVPPSSETKPLEVVGLSRHTLERLAKVRSESKHGYVRAGLYGTTRMIRLDWQLEPRTMLVMPIRLDGTVDWGVPGL